MYVNRKVSLHLNLILIRLHFGRVRSDLIYFQGMIIIPIEYLSVSTFPVTKKTIFSKQVLGFFYLKRN